MDADDELVSWLRDILNCFPPHIRERALRAPPGRPPGQTMKKVVMDAVLGQRIATCRERGMTVEETADALNTTKRTLERHLRIRQ